MGVLVVVPVYNRAQLVSRALDSVAIQTYKPAAVIIIDDGSTDDTAKVIQSWISANKAVNARLISTSNRGASAARNLGIREGSGGFQYVAFLDSDDIWPEDFLERGCMALDKNMNAIAVSSDREFHALDSSRVEIDSLVSLPNNPWLWMVMHGAGIGSCTVFRVDAINAAGGYPEDIPTGHDNVLFGRIAAIGEWLHVPGKPTIFTRGDSSAGGSFHLHMRYADHLTWWAKSIQMCWQSAPVGMRGNRLAKKHLAKRWQKAANSALRRLQYDEARWCLRQAYQNRPLEIKNLKLFFQLYLIRWQDEVRRKYSG